MSGSFLEEVVYRFKSIFACIFTFVNVFLVFPNVDDLEISAITYFGIFEIALNGREGEIMVLEQLKDVFEPEKIRYARPNRSLYARPNRSLMEFERGGERP